MKLSHYEIYTDMQPDGCANLVNPSRYLAVWEDEDLTERVRNCYGESVAKDFTAIKVDTIEK